MTTFICVVIVGRELNLNFKDSDDEPDFTWSTGTTSTITVPSGGTTYYQLRPWIEDKEIKPYGLEADVTLKADLAKERYGWIEIVTEDGKTVTVNLSDGEVEVKEDEIQI